MRRLFVFLLMTLCLVLTACAGGGTAVPETTPEAPPEESTAAAAAALEENLAAPVYLPETEPDYYLRFDQETYPITTEPIPFQIVNTTRADASILLIPTLERETADGGWEVILFRAKIGFCGTPDPLPAGEKDWSEDLVLLWGVPENGRYRLSYTVTDSQGQEHTASGIFTVAAELCSYPLAPEQ